MSANLSSTSKIIDTILVLDFGSQYTQLIARRVRDSNVYSEILPWDIDEKKFNRSIQKVLFYPAALNLLLIVIHRGYLK